MRGKIDRIFMSLFKLIEQMHLERLTPKERERLRQESLALSAYREQAKRELPKDVDMTMPIAKEKKWKN